ncbi:acetate--CoA ligase family protein [Anaeroselena agilis]|uniref:Acetate--CoA ligase family protein n=1 Tax=Anaeroselena agilis TaxID=3063788 RepID=A0ABU3P5H6_9FIRM|nr:acetate--CoA ligase family protein [Selenomonadales bacterium 4137-cl]
MDCRKIITSSIAAGDAVIPELEAQQICRAYDIACPATVLAPGKAECIAAATSMGFPVVIKIFSRQIVHKSDVGGVVTGIATADELGRAYDRMLANIAKSAPGAEIGGVIVQKQMPKGVEVVVGGLRNDQFGPVVMFGMGGIYVEVFKDVSFRLAPLDKDEALRQVRETKVYKLLQGVRGDKPCDIDALCEVMVNTGKLLAEYPEIAELDFNPVFCYPDGCTVVDARLVLKSS